MAETLFHFDATNYLDCQRNFRGANNQEYYDGDLTIRKGAVIDVRAERKAVGPVSLIRLRSRTQHVFRRNWSHIRKDSADLSVLWFIRRGQLRLTTPRGAMAANPGDFVVTRSTTPFCITCQPDDDLAHEALHVTIPTHILREHVAEDIAGGLMLSAMPRQLRLAGTLFETLLDDDGLMAPDTAQGLLDTALVLVSHGLRDRDRGGQVRKGTADRRVEEVLRFIAVHLTDPNLDTTMVAQGCHISPRHLSFLLSQRGTSFSKLVWEQRLAKAQSWLCAADPKTVSINEIAFSLGFKSSAHFSRSFARAFGVNPRDYRQLHGPRE